MSSEAPQTAYYDEKKAPRLVRSYCVFVDFLGFRHEIKAAVQSGQEEAVFHRFMRKVEPEIQRIIVPSDDDTLEGWPRMWDAKVFTDNVVLGYALWSGHGEKEFGHAICQLMEFQLSVALQGHFVRGGWAVGNLFMNQNTVFGSALLDAHDLESNHANYPRIVLSPEMKDYVLHHMAFYASDPPQCEHLLIDGKDDLATNYLSETVVDGCVEWELLEQHAQVISKSLGEHAGNERVLPKYQWLAAYHNYFCGLVRNGEGYSDVVRVRGEFPDFGIRCLRREDSPYPPSAKKAWR
jgi:hypothetical protein